MRPVERSDFDTQMMQIALGVAARGLGRTAPNPSVGAVIADERTGEIIARGWTAPGGRPHAETEAIARAGARARGATMYVTLEPCSHHGVTAPCADAIVGAGLARVVCAIEDPDPRVAGRGLAHLRKAGIAVERGLMVESAHWLAAGHILRVTERRPLVTAKLALDADGSVPRGGAGKPVWATGPAARAAGHLCARAPTQFSSAGARSSTTIRCSPAVCRVLQPARRCASSSPAILPVWKGRAWRKAHACIRCGYSAPRAPTPARYAPPVRRFFQWASLAVSCGCRR